MPRRDPHDLEGLVDLPLQAEDLEDSNETVLSRDLLSDDLLSDDLLAEDLLAEDLLAKDRSQAPVVQNREKILRFPQREPSADPPEATSDPDADDEPFAAPDGAAPFVERLLGGLTDLFIQAALVGAAWAGTTQMDVRVELADWPPFAVLALVVSFLYSFIPLAFWGQTPGMAWRGHVAVSLDESPLRFGQTTLRWLGSLLTLGLVGLPLLLAFTGRTLSDRLSDSKTLVE